VRVGLYRLKAREVRVHWGTGRGVMEGSNHSRAIDHYGCGRGAISDMGAGVCC
jgi:hypothetical protein